MALSFAAHGFAHAVGIGEILGLRGEASNTSTLFASLDPSSVAYRALGALWVVALVLFVAAAAGIVLRKSWWLVAAFAAALVSLALCVAWYDAAIVGLVVNVVILAGLVVYTVAQGRATR